MGELVIMPEKNLEELQILNPRRHFKSYLIPAVMIDTDGFGVLVELIQGTVVVDIEKAKMVKIINPSEVTAAEFKIMKLGMSLRLFDENDIRIGLSQARIRDILDEMCKKDLLIWENRKYKVCDGFAFQFNPKNFSIKRELVEIRDISLLKAEPLAANISVSDAKQKLGNFISVNKTFPCHILYHYMEK